MSNYVINFIGFGNVKGGRCMDAETQLNMILEDDPEVLCIAPYTLIAPGQPTMINGKVSAAPPKMIPGFAVITKHEEQEQQEKERS